MKLCKTLFVLLFNVIAIHADNNFFTKIGGRAQSTPLKQIKGNIASIGIASTVKRRVRKRKTNSDNNNLVIDLTPKKFESNGLAYSSSESDVEIVDFVDEVIEVDDDENSTDGCNKVVDVPSVSTESETVKNTQTNEDKSIPVDTVVSTENGKIDCLEETLVYAANDNICDDIRENDSLPCSSKDYLDSNLYIKDTVGGGSLQPPLYDMVSDDSFCFDLTPTPLSQISSKSFDLTELSQISRNSFINISDDVTLMPSPKRIASSSTCDDSVIFVSETNKTSLTNGMPHPTPNFIPINRNNTKRTKAARKSPRKRQRVSGNAVKTSIGLSGSSRENKKKFIEGEKRMVIIDGSNVALTHGNGDHFSIEGIEICLDYFIKLGYETKAVLPQMRQQKAKSTNPQLLEKLHKEKKIVFTPCKTLKWKHVVSYDDRMIFDFAIKFDAVVISNDYYRDLRHEKEEYADLIDNRIIGFTFFNDEFVIPTDPYGRDGPSVEEILRRVK